MGELDHRTDGLGAIGERQGCDHLLRLGRIQLTRSEAGTDASNARRHVQTPGQASERVAPGGRVATHGLAEGGVKFDFATSGTEADGLEVGTVLTIEALGHFDERSEGDWALEIAERQSHFTPDRGRSILGIGHGKAQYIAVSSA